MCNVTWLILQVHVYKEGSDAVFSKEGFNIISEKLHCVCGKSQFRNTTLRPVFALMSSPASVRFRSLSDWMGENGKHAPRVFLCLMYFQLSRRIGRNRDMWRFQTVMHPAVVGQKYFNWWQEKKTKFQCHVMMLDVYRSGSEFASTSHSIFIYLHNLGIYLFIFFNDRWYN